MCAQGVPKAGKWGETSTRDGEHPDHVLGVGQQQHTETITVHMGHCRHSLKTLLLYTLSLAVTLQTETLLLSHLWLKEVEHICPMLNDIECLFPFISTQSMLCFHLLLYKPSPGQTPVGQRVHLPTEHHTKTHFINSISPTF